MTRPTTLQLRHSAVIDFAHALVTAVLNRLLHSRDSSFVRDSLAELVTALQHAAALGAELPLAVQFDSQRMHWQGRALDGPSLQARTLLQACEDRGIAVLSFGPQLTGDEANRLLDLLLLPANQDALRRERRDAVLRALGIRNVRVTLREPADPGNRCRSLDPGSRALDHYQDLADVLQQNHRRAHRDQEMAIDATSTAIERTLADFDEPSLLLSLAMQDDVDRFTVGHSVRVALLALQVARGIGASRPQLVQVGAAALMHDIGKSKVPQEVLFKRGRLNADEWHWMTQHPRLGAELLLEQHDEVDPRAIGAAFCHHMRPDGSGYPEPELAIAPSGTSRLVRICDVFEALTAVRPYKHALTPIEAYAVMFRNQTDFDPVWLRRFVRTLGLFPNGTRVELTNGAEGVVTAQTVQIDRPVVRLLTGPGGNDLPPGHPELVTVGQPLDGVVPWIRRVNCHDRHVPIPDYAPDAASVLAQTGHGACLSTTMPPRIQPAQH